MERHVQHDLTWLKCKRTRKNRVSSVQLVQLLFYSYKLSFFAFRLSLGDFISINIFIWRKCCKDMYHAQCRSMQHCKCDTSNKNKNYISDGMNSRTNEPIFDTHQYITHITLTYIKSETVVFVEWKVFCVGLVFCYSVPNYIVNLVGEIKWTEIMGGKSAMHTSREKEQNACKFYFMHLNLRNKSWMWCGRTENVPLNATSSNNWLEIRCNGTKNGRMKTNKIQFYLVFCSIFPFASAAWIFYPVLFVEAKQPLHKMDFLCIFRRNLHKSAPTFATHCACSSTYQIEIASISYSKNTICGFLPQYTYKCTWLFSLQNCDFCILFAN